VDLAGSCIILDIHSHAQVRYPHCVPRTFTQLIAKCASLQLEGSTPVPCKTVMDRQQRHVHACSPCTERGHLGRASMVAHNCEERSQGVCSAATTMQQCCSHRT
jgi:hypothetical protein